MTMMLTHRHPKMVRRLKQALIEHFGPDQVKPDLDQPDTMRVYYWTKATRKRMCALVHYDENEGRLHASLGAQTWALRVQENSRTAWRDRTEELFKLVRNEAKARETLLIEREKAEKKQIAREKRAYKLYLEHIQKEYQRAVRKGRLWYVGGSCSRTQYRYAGLGTCVGLNDAFMYQCVSLPDLSDFSENPMPVYAERSGKAPKAGVCDKKWMPLVPEATEP